MSSSIGRELRYSLFGESHGPALGAVLDGLPAGVPVDEAAIAFQMGRRKPGSSKLATQRKEGDAVEIVSGFKDGKSSGGPLCFLIRNADAHSADYDPDLPRPSHADLAEWRKDGPQADMRGGGRFSGRLTAPLVAAGSVARQILARRGVLVGAHVLRIGSASDAAFPDSIPARELEKLAFSYIPTLDPAAAAAMETQIEEARMKQDSIGGAVEVACFGLPAGVGEPPFDGVESALSQWVFAVPGVKALEFGLGAGFAAMRGSEANDPIGLKGGKPVPLSNRSGGANGGISNGNPIRFTATLRPTPSISIAQRSVRLSTMEEAELRVKGRHDPCIVPRALPALEAACALCLLDLLMQSEGRGWMA